MDSSPPASASASATTANDDASEARKIVVIEQLTSGYGFEAEAAEKAVEAVGANVASAVAFILDNGMGKDQGGSIVPKDDCPHVKDHVKIDVDKLPDHPQHALCSYFTEKEQQPDDVNDKDRVGRPKSDPDNPDGDKESCSTGENWLCLECGVIRCSRYVNGHGLDHWKESKESENSTSTEGHCVAASLADLSVWCHECASYVQHPLLDPLVQRLEQLKFEEAAEPKKKKARPSHPHEGAGLAQSSGDETSVNKKSDDDDDDDDDDDENEEGSDSSPTIIQIASAVARGYGLFQSAENEEEELEYPFDNLPRSLEAVANFIQSDKCRSVVVLAGAGMSVSAGIPDFRSANGLYATMNPDLLSADPVEREAIRMDPTVALEQGMFLQNPLPLLELNREFILGTRNQKWKATLAHRFVELLHAKTGKLVRLYTQNIDGLEDQCAQLPREKVIAVHGSMDRAECANCGQESDYGEFCDRVQEQIKDLSGNDEQAPQESSPIICSACGYRTVKPAIVLFRSSLPVTFFENVPRDVLDVDLLIIIGTSLRVAPANSLVWRVPKTALRVLVNREPVGWHLGVAYGPDSKRDVFAQGNCDFVLLDLMAHLGWLDDLEPLLEEDKLPDVSASLLRKKLGKDETESDNNAKPDSSVRTYPQE